MVSALDHRKVATPLWISTSELVLKSQVKQEASNQENKSQKDQETERKLWMKERNFIAKFLWITKTN